MRVEDGLIVLAQPVAGHRVLSGSFVVMTTWIDYRLVQPLNLADLGLTSTETEVAFPTGPTRLLIPLNNVLAVITEADQTEEYEKYLYGKPPPKPEVSGQST